VPPGVHAGGAYRLSASTGDWAGELTHRNRSKAKEVLAWLAEDS
jgi:hypothetical protein